MAGSLRAGIDGTVDAGPQSEAFRRSRPGG